MATPGDFDVRAEAMPSGAVVLHVSGELDLSSAPRLEHAIADAGSTAHIVIDLAACTFLDSAGVQTLITAARDAGPERRVDLVATNPRVLRVLEITGVDSVLAVHPSVDAAL